MKNLTKAFGSGIRIAFLKTRIKINAKITAKWIYNKEFNKFNKKIIRLKKDVPSSVLLYENTMVYNIRVYSKVWFVNIKMKGIKLSLIKYFM